MHAALDTWPATVYHGAMTHSPWVECSTVTPVYGRWARARAGIQIRGTTDHGPPVACRISPTEAAELLEALVPALYAADQEVALDALAGINGWVARAVNGTVSPAAVNPSCPPLGQPNGPLRLA